MTASTPAETTADATATDATATADATAEATATDDVARRETKTARQLNTEIMYTMYAVLAVRPGALPPEQHEAAAAEAQAVLDAAAAKSVTTRGCYDVSGFRAGADLMLWLVAADPAALQETLARVRQTTLGRACDLTWSAVGLHRPAEFNKNHIPAYLRGEAPKDWICVYPFVRSLDWYLIEDSERRTMLAEHGMMARDYPDVRANTVSAFALGDYEWLLAFECDDLERIVDLMRHLRSAEARRHTREELPFHTGLRRPLAEIVASLS